MRLGTRDIERRRFSLLQEQVRKASGHDFSLRSLGQILAVWQTRGLPQPLYELSWIVLGNIRQLVLNRPSEQSPDARRAILRQALQEREDLLAQRLLLKPCQPLEGQTDYRRRLGSLDDLCRMDGGLEL